MHNYRSEHTEASSAGILPESILVPLLLLMAPIIKIQTDICRASGTIFYHDLLSPPPLSLSLARYRSRTEYVHGGESLLLSISLHVFAIAAHVALGWYSTSDSGLER